jgi:DNA-binding response OmpR family regulator
VIRARRVLVVDDQPEIRGMTETILAGAGYEVGTAENGEEALRRIRRERFDLVLLDVNMPGMDGWETLRLLRADPSFGSLPVAMFTVKTEVRDRIHGMQEGAVDYITKPFAVDDLLLRVERILARSVGGSEARR